MTPTMTDDLISRVQRGFLSVADDLQRLDRQLSALVDCLDDERGTLPREIASIAEAVRHDLVHDAIDTLMALGYQTEEGAAGRQRAVAAACELLAPTAG